MTNQPLPFVNPIMACVDKNSTMTKLIIYLGIVVRVKTSTRSAILAELEVCTTLKTINIYLNQDLHLKSLLNLWYILLIVSIRRQLSAIN